MLVRKVITVAKTRIVSPDFVVLLGHVVEILSSEKARRGRRRQRRKRRQRRRRRRRRISINKKYIE